jgi:hypothetical protein
LNQFRKRKVRIEVRGKFWPVRLATEKVSEVLRVIGYTRGPKKMSSLMVFDVNVIARQW